MKVGDIKQVIYVVFFIVETMIFFFFVVVGSMLKIYFNMQIWLIFLWQQHRGLYGD